MNWLSYFLGYPVLSLEINYEPKWLLISLQINKEAFPRAWGLIWFYISRIRETNTTEAGNPTESMRTNFDVWFTYLQIVMWPWSLVSYCFKLWQLTFARLIRSEKVSELRRVKINKSTQFYSMFFAEERIRLNNWLCFILR